MYLSEVWLLSNTQCIFCLYAEHSGLHKDIPSRVHGSMCVHEHACAHECVQLCVHVSLLRVCEPRVCENVSRHV